MKRVSAAALSLVTLITPVLALGIGNLLNGETISPQGRVRGRCYPAGAGQLPVGRPLLRRLRRAVA